MRTEGCTCTNFNCAGWAVASKRRRMASITASGQPLATKPENCHAHSLTFRIHLHGSLTQRSAREGKAETESRTPSGVIMQQSLPHTPPESHLESGQGQSWGQHSGQWSARTVMHEESLIRAAASSAVTNRSRSRDGCAALQ